MVYRFLGREYMIPWRNLGKGRVNSGMHIFSLQTYHCNNALFSFPAVGQRSFAYCAESTKESLEEAGRETQAVRSIVDELMICLFFSITCPKYLDLIASIILSLQIARIGIQRKHWRQAKANTTLKGGGRKKTHSG